MNAKILSGPFGITADGVDHPSAVAILHSLNLSNEPNPLSKQAVVVVRYYHTLADLQAYRKHVFEISYLFKVGGTNPFETIFVPGQDSQANLFTYIKGLPEFSGWNEQTVSVG